MPAIKTVTGLTFRHTQSTLKGSSQAKPPTVSTWSAKPRPISVFGCWATKNLHGGEHLRNGFNDPGNILNASGMDADAYEAFPTLEFDSFMTLGADNADQSPNPFGFGAWGLILGQSSSRMEAPTSPMAVGSCSTWASRLALTRWAFIQVLPVTTTAC